MYRVRFGFRDGRRIRLAIANDHDDPLLVWGPSEHGLTEIEALVDRQDVLKLIAEFGGSTDPVADLDHAEQTVREIRAERLNRVVEAVMGED
ncbi:MAG: hypothetical protein AMXMBFR13_06910 [Phycisphaerae bacterium]